MFGLTGAVPVEFEFWKFDPAYSLVTESEFPGSGTWSEPVYNFDRSGQLISDPATRWGPPLTIEFHPDASPRWVGVFAAGGLGGLTGVYACPSRTQVAVVVDGLAYLVDVTSVHSEATVVHDQVTQVVPVEADLLLLVRVIDIIAIGLGGIQWRSSRLAVHDLRVESASCERIVCSCDLLQADRAFIALDPHTGSQIDGPRIDSFWPPDAR